MLSATPAFGGIEVSWTYPASNPHAVSYVKLYRNTTASFASSLLIAEVGGARYYDKLDTGTTYYYWIQIVSINGTIGEVIGPASATARPLIADLIEQLTGQIDNGMLATSLKTEIDKITLNYGELQEEILNRIAQGETLSLAMSDLDDAVQQTLAYIGEELVTRANGDNALAVQINAVAALNDTLAALITSEQLARVTADEALALSIDSILAAGGGVAAAVSDAMAAKVGYSAKNDGFSTPYDGNNSFIVYPEATYPTATYPDYAFDRKRIIDKLGVTRWNADGANSATPLIWVAGLPLATAIKRVGVTGPDGAAASLETAMTAQSTLNGGLKALYTVKLNVDGLAGGFGIYNDGATVEAGFDCDTFWVGRSAKSGVTGVAARKPFMVVGSETFIDQAVINKLTFSKLTDEAGTFIVADGKVQAAYINTNGLSVRDSAGNIILNAGSSAFSGNVTGTVGGVAVGTLNASVAAALADADAAQTTADSAAAGLSLRLRNDAQNVLAGPGGLATGTLTWDSSGVRTGGYGVGITQNGIAAYNSAGVATFSLNGATGAATFAGALSGATGTFAGALAAATGSFSGVLTAGAVNAVTTINIAGNAVSANASVGGTAETISTSVTVPAGETFQILGIGIQTGTAPENGVTNIPAAASLVISRGGSSLSSSIARCVVDVVDGDAVQPYWGYASTVVSGIDTLTAGTHTVSLTGISGLMKTLLVMISKR